MGNRLEGWSWHENQLGGYHCGSGEREDSSLNLDVGSGAGWTHRQKELAGHSDVSDVGAVVGDSVCRGWMGQLEEWRYCGLRWGLLEEDQVWVGRVLVLEPAGFEIFLNRSNGDNQGVHCIWVWNSKRGSGLKIHIWKTSVCRQMVSEGNRWALTQLI